MLTKIRVKPRLVAGARSQPLVKVHGHDEQDRQNGGGELPEPEVV